MGVFYESLENPECKLAIWKTEETTGELCQLLGISGSELPARVESRQKEWLTIRILVKKLLSLKGIPLIDYDEKGKPSLKDSEYSISISHSKEFVGVILSGSQSCGIDLEIIHPRIKKIAARFLMEDEKQFMDEKLALNYLYVIWGAKEVLYKLHGKGNILFKEHLKVEPFIFESEGKVTAHILKENYSKTYSIYYRQIENVMLTYAVE